MIAIDTSTEEELKIGISKEQIVLPEIINLETALDNINILSNAYRIYTEQDANEETLISNFKSKYLVKKYEEMFKNSNL